jgi:hypothetical protein
MEHEPNSRELMDAMVDLRNGIADQFRLVWRRFDAVDAKLVEHDGRFDALEFHVSSLDRRVGHIETRLEDFERRLPA